MAVGGVISTVARFAGGLVQGGASLVWPASSSWQSLATSDVTIKVVSWTPAPAVTLNRFEIRRSMQAASGSDFVVGGLYYFTPETQTLPANTTLVLTYTADAATGIDTSKLQLFRWNAPAQNWQPVAGQLNMSGRAFTATVTELGTYALGVDTQPPQISMLNPTSGAQVPSRLPIVNAIVTDAGSGINPSSVQMKLVGQVVAATYITTTGELQYVPWHPISLGPHALVVKAPDVAGI